MSISNQTDKIFGTGDGVTTVFSFPFKIFAAADLVIYEIDTTQTPNINHLKSLGTDYTVSINTVGEGGTVTFTIAPPSTWQTLIQRVEPFTQSLSLNTEGNLPAQQIENQLDLMTMLCIQVNEAVSRCPQLPVTFAGTLPLTMPSPQAGLVLGWDPTGSFLVNMVSTTIGTIALPLSNGNISPLIAPNLVKGSSLYNLSTTPVGAGVFPAANIPTNGLVPIGGIIMWSGTIATIPANWALCNGSNGTPDIRNQFIVGANADAGGVAKSTISGSAAQSGGSVTILQANLPSYNLVLSPVDFGNGSGLTGIQGTTNGASPSTVNVPSAGSGTAYLQPYYALAYIMRTA